MRASESLPIYELRAALAQALRPQSGGVRLIVEAPTGSGKSTQIPRLMLNDGLVPQGEIVVLQPRRLAARMLARRVAFEQGSRLGETVGYQVRFERAVSERTRIRYVTEGILLRELMLNPTLPHVGAIVFDEFHERHLYGDITLARALDLQASRRPDLALVVMSATLDTARLQGYLAPCVTLRSEGRTFPVDVHYSAAKSLTEEPWDHAARVCAAAARETAGHMLVFMPGAYEIRKTIEAVRREKFSRDFDVLPLHGELPPGEQDRAVDGEEGGRRRIIVSTNVAETSLTIDGVTTVIDSGLARMAQFDARRGIDTLTVQKISQASAQQRTGRAGRTVAGTCWRLWSDKDHARRPAQELPEVLRMDLAEVVLTLLASGVEDLDSFRWLEKPDSTAMAHAAEVLRTLGAIEADAMRITPLGKKLTAYPVHPRHARVLEAAREHECAAPIALTMALLQGRPLFGKSGAAAPDSLLDGYEFSDLQPLWRAWEAARAAGYQREPCMQLGVNGLAAREAGQLAGQLLRIAGDRSPPTEWTREPDARTLGYVLLTGFSDQVGRRTSQGSLACDLPGGRRGQIPKESLVRKAPLVVAAEVREIEGRDVQVILSGLTAIEENWLAELFPGDFQRKTEALWDEVQRRVLQKERVMFRDLVLAERQSGEPNRDAAAAILAEKVLAGELKLTGWDDAVEQWIIRLNRLAQWMPELDMPALTAEDRAFVIAQMCHGAFSYKDIKDKAPWPTLRSWLSPQQAGWLDQYAPERFALPDGRTAKVVYAETGDPMISARIQQLYGLDDTPKIAAGRVPLVVSILAPSQRPLQVTKDLAGFWKNHYPRIKQELQRKYPKHLWK